MDGPPSFTSLTTRNDSDQQLQHQVTEPKEFEEDEYNPSMSKIRPLDNEFEVGSTFARAIVQPIESVDDAHDQAISIGAMVTRGKENNFPDGLTDTSYNNEPAPSMGRMVGDRGNSQPAGGEFNYDAQAPPSLTDAARRDRSYTGGESDDGQNVSEGEYDGLSITGRDSGKLHAVMSQMDDGDDPWPF